LHDGIGRPDSVGEFLQFRQKVRRSRCIKRTSPSASRPHNSARRSAGGHLVGWQWIGAFHASPTVRAALAAHFEGTVAGWNAGMVADLHRVAELGTSEGMQLILNEARRRGVVLYPEPDPADAEAAPIRHDPKHVALHT
jgi:hypothetical protein